MDWKYIIKRVLVGVLVFLAIYFLKNYILLDVHAQEISSYNWGSQTFTVTTNTSSNEFNVQNEPWANWRYGYLYFSIGVNKTGGSSTDPILLIRNVIVFSGTTGYICNIGTNNVNNSTWDASVYSVTCPMDLGAPGVSRVVIGYMPISTQTTSSYTVTVGGYATYEQASNVSVNVDTSTTTSAINNQITNDNTNTTNIINNQNQNTQQQIESQKVCTLYDYSIVSDSSQTLDSNGNVISGIDNQGVSSWIPISSNDELTVLASGVSRRYCFYNTNKSRISCNYVNYDSTFPLSISIPSTASYIRFVINSSNEPQYKLCRNGNQAIADGQQQINDTLNNSNVDSSTSKGSDFFLQFADPTNPLLDVLLFPINLLSATTDSCAPIHLSVFEQDVALPCGTTIFWDKSEVATFKTWWNMFFGGIAIFFLLTNLFHVINNAVDPFKDDVGKLGGF